MKKQWFIIAFVLFLFTLQSEYIYATEVPKAAIIIDDFGGNVKGVEEFLSGKVPITVAIMPFLAQSTEQAEKAHHAGLEVIIHLPMEPKKGKASWLGPKAITSSLSNEEVRELVLEAITDVPHAVGLNNHMGSKIVENERIIRIILEVLKEHSLYIIDSGTSGKSVIPKLAEEIGVPYAVRDVFLDDTMSSRQHVQKQMNKLTKVTVNKGKGIGIGHVGVKGDETVAGIADGLPFMQKKGISLVPASQLIETEIDKDPEHFWIPSKKNSP